MLRTQKHAKSTYGLKVKHKPPVELAFGGIIDTQYYPPKVKSFLNSHGDEVIRSITLGRTELNSTVKSLINKISLNTLDKVVKKLGYDRLFHLFMIVKTDKGSYRIEKNQTINAESGTMPSGAETLDVPVKKEITLNEFFENGRKRMGDKDFFEYDAFNRNCQKFIKGILIANQFSTPVWWIDQNAEKIVKELPWYAKATGTITNLITDAGAVVDLFIQKLGLGSL